MHQAQQASQLFLVTRFYFIFFALVCFGSGSWGFVKTQSVASLVAGGVAGVLLYATTIFYHSDYYKAALVVDILVSLALLGRFAPALFRKQYNPAGYMVPLALIGFALGVLLFLSPAVHP